MRATTKRDAVVRWRLTLCLLAAVAVGCGEASIREPSADVTAALAMRQEGSGGGGSATTTQSTGTGWGTLKGVFRYAGAAPQPGFLSTGGKDGAVCGAQVPNESIVVGDGGGLANVVVFARKVSRVHEDGQKPPEDAAVFDQKKCLFLSHVLGVQVGQTVLLKNSDPVGHNTNISPIGNPSSNTILQASGGEAQYSFTRALASPTEVTCNIHPWMKAYLMARDDPYFAVTNDDGSFEIANLPAGESIEFQVWHERKPDGLAAKSDWARGRFTITVPADGVQDLGVVEVSPAALQ